MVTKIYESTHYLHFQTTVQLKNGKYVPIEFKGGVRFGNQICNGMYQTSDKDIQEAIENDADFDKSFKLKDSFGTEDAPVCDDKKGKGKKKDDSLTLQAFPDIITVQDAAEKLAELGIDKTTVLDIPSIMEAAKTVNVEFPNLK